MCCCTHFFGDKNHSRNRYTDTHARTHTLTQGSHMVHNLMKKGYNVVVFDIAAPAVKQVQVRSFVASTNARACPEPCSNEREKKLQLFVTVLSSLARVRACMRRTGRARQAARRRRRRAPSKSPNRQTLSSPCCPPHPTSRRFVCWLCSFVFLGLAFVVLPLTL